MSETAPSAPTPPSVNQPAHLEVVGQHIQNITEADRAANTKDYLQATVNGNEATHPLHTPVLEAARAPFHEIQGQVKGVNDEISRLQQQVLGMQPTARGYDTAAAKRIKQDIKKLQEQSASIIEHGQTLHAPFKSQVEAAALDKIGDDLNDRIVDFWGGEDFEERAEAAKVRTQAMGRLALGIDGKPARARTADGSRNKRSAAVLDPTAKPDTTGKPKRTRKATPARPKTGPAADTADDAADADTTTVDDALNLALDTTADVDTTADTDGNVDIVDAAIPKPDAGDVDDFKTALEGMTSSELLTLYDRHQAIILGGVRALTSREDVDNIKGDVRGVLINMNKIVDAMADDPVRHAELSRAMSAFENSIELSLATSFQTESNMSNDDMNAGLRANVALLDDYFSDPDNSKVPPEDIPNLKAIYITLQREHLFGEGYSPEEIDNAIAEIDARYQLDLTTPDVDPADVDPAHAADPTDPDAIKTPDALRTALDKATKEYIEASAKQRNSHVGRLTAGKRLARLLDKLPVVGRRRAANRNKHRERDAVVQGKRQAYLDSYGAVARDAFAQLKDSGMSESQIKRLGMEQQIKDHLGLETAIIDTRKNVWSGDKHTRMETVLIKAASVSSYVGNRFAKYAKSDAGKKVLGLAGATTGVVVGIASGMWIPAAIIGGGSFAAAKYINRQKPSRRIKDTTAPHRDHVLTADEKMLERANKENQALTRTARTRYSTDKDTDKYIDHTKHVEKLTEEEVRKNALKLRKTKRLGAATLAGVGLVGGKIVR